MNHDEYGDIEKNADPLSLFAATAGLGAAWRLPQIMSVAGRGGEKLLGKFVDAFRPRKGVVRATVEAFKKIPAGKQLNDADRQLIRLGLLGAVGGGFAASKAIKMLGHKPSRMMFMKEIIKDPDIPESDYTAASQIYGVIQQYAPSLSKNVDVSRSLVKQQIAATSGLTTDVITPDFIHRLAESEKKVKESGGDILGALGVAAKASV